MNTLKSFFVHYKTSLAGIVASAANLYANGHSLQSVLVSIGIALLGLFSADSSQTVQK